MRLIETMLVRHWSTRVASGYLVRRRAAVPGGATDASPRAASGERVMAKGYWMFHTTVSDAETYRKYVEQDAEAFMKYGARFLARGGEFLAAEGAARERHVIIAFDSYEIALACYRSPEYQTASEFRRAAAATDLVIVQGAF